MDLETLWQMLTDTKFLGVSLADAIGKIVLVVVVTVSAYVIQRLVSRLAKKVLDAAQVPSASIIINILRGLIWSLGLITIIEPVFGIKPTAFIAALGVGSVALSLGMQDTVSNIIGGLTLMLSRVIEPGDAIKIGDFTGVVADINWRSTNVRDAYGQENIIPNSVLSKTALVKLSDYTRSRCQISIVIKHGTDLNEVVADIAREARDVLGSRVDLETGVEVFIERFDISGIQAKANVHLVRGVSVDEARTMLAQRLVSRPWVAHFG